MIHFIVNFTTDQIHVLLYKKNLYVSECAMYVVSPFNQCKTVTAFGYCTLSCIVTNNILVVALVVGKREALLHSEKKIITTTTTTDEQS